MLRPVGDTISGAAIIAAWLNVLSIGMTIAATTAALVYTCIRIYEMKSVQQFLEKRRSKAEK